MNNDHPIEAGRIFHGAMEIELNDERLAFLDKECRGDEELYAHVKRLLESSSQLEEFMPTEPGNVGPEVTITDGPGDVIGRYKLLQKLGEGGFGVVYMAEQKEPVKRRVALKIIKLGMDTQQVVGRFEAERQALALMDHPNIAKVLDGGATETGRPFFVMELVKGIPITSYCSQEKLSTRERIDLFMKVCRAIQHAHQKGVIHRDIKPSNIMITLHDGVPVPKVIDFGIAKATQQELTERTVFTQYSQFIGTPAYMSPEQAEMSGLDIDTRSDVYSLGVLFYELLTGATPFDSKELMASGIDAMRQTIRESEPMKPSTRVSQTLESAGAASLRGDAKTRAEPGGPSFSQLLAELRGDLDWIVMKCLEKDRSRRYETANALVADLQRHLENVPIIARPPSLIYQLGKAWRRNKVVYGAGSFVVTALVFATAISAMQSNRATKAKEEAIRLKEVANQEKNRAIASESLANAAKTEAERESEEKRRHLYAANVYAAHALLKEGNLGAATQLLDACRPGEGERDLRGWEWRYLHERSKGDHREVLYEHPRGLTGLALSPDERIAVLGDSESGITILDLSGEMPLPIQQFNDVQGVGFVGIRFSSSGKYFAGVFLSNPRLWGVFRFEYETAELVQMDWGEFYSVHFFPRTDRALIVRGSGRSEILDLETGERSGFWESVPADSPLRERVRDDVIRTSTLADDGKTVIFGGRRNWHGSLDLVTGEFVETMVDWKKEISGHSMASIYPLPDGTDFITTSHLDPVIRWRIEPDGIRKVADYGERVLWKPSVHADRNWLVFPGTDHSLRIWDIESMKEIRRLHGHHDEVWKSVVRSNGEILSVGMDGRLLVWALAEPGIAAGTSTETVIGRRIVFSSDGAMLALPLRDGKGSAIVDAATGLRVRNVPRATPISFSQDGSILYLAELASLPELRSSGPTICSGRVLSVDPRTGRAVSPLIGRALGRCISPWMAAPDIMTFYCQDRERRIGFRLSTGEEVFALHENPMGESGYLATSPNGQTRVIATGIGDMYVGLKPFEVWDMSPQSEDPILTIDTQFTRAISGAEFSPDGHLLAVFSFDGSIHLFETDSWRLRKNGVLDGHRRAVLDVSFSPDGLTLASAADDGLINLWNVETGRLMTSIELKGGVFSVKFSPDGERVAAVVGPSFQEARLELFRAPTLQEIDDRRGSGSLMEIQTSR